MKRLIWSALALLSALSALAENSPSRPKIYGVAFVRFKATDFEKSRIFYEKTLGLRGGFDACKNTPGLCYVVNPGQHVELVQAGSRERDSLLEEIGFLTSDVSNMRKYLLSLSQSPGPLLRGPNGLRFFEVADPEGNRIAFVESSGADAQVDGLSQICNRAIHAGFVVRDRAAEDHFFKDILGFHLYWHGGMKDDETSWVAMQVPDGTDWVEYMLNISPDADKQTLGVMNHIALGVPDIQAAKAQLIKNGWKPGEEPKMGRDGKWQLNLYDPDDTRVEFMEFKPVEKPCCSEFTGPHPGPRQ